MTPGARVAAAIGILDQMLAGMPAEQALTNWGRASRYAGSGDRAGVRDLVFSALRCRRSFAGLGGSDSGRGLMIGAMRAAGEDPAAVFNGVGHAPVGLTGSELAAGGLSPMAALDCPDWLAPALRDSLGADFAPVMRLLQQRAPVFLRVNLRRTDVTGAVAALAAAGIAAGPHPLARTALEVTGNARKIQGSQAYLGGLVELQDVASQAVLERLPLAGARVLDYCAGGGGKALAMAAAGAEVWAHDAEPRRMQDLPARALRAGVSIPVLDTAALRAGLLAASPAAATFDLVLLDVPCSGSGSWRRSPEGKWALTPARLAELQRVQAEILDLASGYVGKLGYLVYTTCSLLQAENADQIAGFRDRQPGWRMVETRRLTPLHGGDGFFMAHLTRE